MRLKLLFSRINLEIIRPLSFQTCKILPTLTKIREFALLMNMRFRTEIIFYELED
jgi:hypothetical protein